MKVVMTLLARDEADIVDAHLAFHLNAGVDFVIATDHASEDATTEILQRYASEGYVLLLREDARDYRQSEVVTKMARLAATDYSADWVVNSDADEFWWPRGHDLKEVLRATPKKYGVLQAFVRHFVPRPDDGGFFADRMTVRIAPSAAINDASSPWRPYPKVIHRAHPHVVVSPGNHLLVEPPLQPFRGWYPVEVLHFPWRSLEQVAVKARHQWNWFQVGSRPPTAYHAKAYRSVEAGRVDDYYDWLAVDDEELNRGLADGTLALDTRLRDQLHLLQERSNGAWRFGQPEPGAPSIGFPAPSVVEDAAYAIDAAVLREADFVRAQRTLDELEQRVGQLERRLGPRITRGLRRLARRLSS